MSKLNNSNRDRHLVGFVPPLGHDVDAGGVVRGEGDCLVLLITSAANRLIGEVVQSRRRPLLGPSPG